MRTMQFKQTKLINVGFELHENNKNVNFSLYTENKRSQTGMKVNENYNVRSNFLSMQHSSTLKPFKFLVIKMNKNS